MTACHYLINLYDEVVKLQVNDQESFVEFVGLDMVDESIMQSHCSKGTWTRKEL